MKPTALCLVLLAAQAFTQEEAAQMSIRAPDPSTLECLGIFGCPDGIWERGERLSDYHINAVFVGHGSLSDELVRRCRREGAKVYAEFGVFQGASVAAEYPELWPINEHGERQAQDEWYLGLCPTVEWYRAEKLELLREVAREYEVDGIWLDFIRYPGHWEVHEPKLEQACFCDSCLAAFEAAANVSLPAGSTARKAEYTLHSHADEWVTFKCDVIRDFCREAKGILAEERPSALLGAFVVPWQPTDYDDAIHGIVAQDFVKLAEVLDVFSPMSYHAMCDRPVTWVGEFNEYLTSATGRPVWPIVQATEREASYEDQPVDAEAFKQALTQGLSGGATGVLMFRIDDCTEANGKLDALRAVYGEVSQ